MFTVHSTPERKKKDNAGFKLRGLGNHDHFKTLLIFVRKKLHIKIEKNIKFKRYFNKVYGILLYIK